MLCGLRVYELQTIRSYDATKKLMYRIIKLKNTHLCMDEMLEKAQDNVAKS